jgi:small subunit ribosomal protein S20
LPRIKSAIKRVSVAERNRQRNIAYKSAIRTAVKKVLQSTPENAETLDAALNQAYSLIDRAILKGILHKNTGARLKARVAKASQRVKTVA